MLPGAGAAVIAAALIEILASVFWSGYPLCADHPDKAQLGQYAATSNRLLIVALVIGAAAFAVPPSGRWRPLGWLLLASIVGLVIASDHTMNRSDEVARHIFHTQSCDEPLDFYSEHPGWFDWVP